LLLGIQKGDDHAQLDKLLDKVLAYRIFPDDAGHMNLSLTDVAGDLLIVSQFTLAADTKKVRDPRSHQQRALILLKKSMMILFCEQT
jgi:D-tyrosyl-tRNA(Tyr) deacylase